MTRLRRPSRWIVVARFAVSLALLWLVSLWVDAGAVVERLSTLRPRWVVLGLAISAAQVGLLAWRWRLTAARLGIELPLREAVGEYYLGILLNQLLPGGVMGDVSRAWRHTRTGVPVGPAVRAVIMERASAQVVMTLVAVASVLLLPWAGVSLRVVLAGAALTLAALVLRGLVARPAATARAGSSRTAGSTPSLGATPDGWRADARRALLAPEVLPAQLASGALVVASYILVFVVAARAVGIDTPLATMLPLVAPVLMTMLIPVTVAGWGIREAAATALWGLAGLTPEDGAAISVAYGLVVLFSSMPGAVVLMRSVTAGRGRTARPPRA